MKKLVTGATGFIGMNLIKALLREGQEVVGLTRRSAQVTVNGLTWLPYPKDLNDWRLVLDGVDTVYHLAWSTIPKTSNDRPVDDALENIIPSLQLFEAAREQDIHIVFASSGGTVYGKLVHAAAAENHPTNPISAYGVSKLSVEGYLKYYRQNYGLSSVSIRISNPYGVGQTSANLFGAVSTFSHAALNREKIVVFGDGTVVRDYIFIDDVVDALCIAGQVRVASDVLNVGIGKGTSLNEVIAILREIIGEETAVEYYPTRQFDVPVSVLDVTLAEQQLNWSAKVGFREGVEKTVEILRRNRTKQQRS